MIARTVTEEKPAPPFLSFTIAKAVSVDGECWFIRNGAKLTVWEVNRELDRLHHLYCTAANVAEYHAGKTDEVQWLAISLMRWDEYELARRNLDALLAERVDEQLAEIDEQAADEQHIRMGY